MSSVVKTASNLYRETVCCKFGPSYGFVYPGVIKIKIQRVPKR